MITVRKLIYLIKRVGLFVCLVHFPMSTHAQSLICERYQTKGVHHMNSGPSQSRQEAFDVWMPEKLVFEKKDIEKFQKITGRKSIEYFRETSITNLSRVWTQKFILLPNKKLLTSHPQGSAVSAKYNCDKGPSEVLASKATLVNKSVQAESISNSPALSLPDSIPSDFDKFRKVTFQFSSGEVKTLGAGKVTSTADGFRTDDRVIISKSLCTTSAEFTNGTNEGSFEINCPDGLIIKGGYVPLGTNNGSIGRGYDNKGNAVEYRLHSNSGSNNVSKADFVRFYEAAFSSSKLDKVNPMDIDKAKSTCTELGFTLGTEKHGECVLKMMDN